MQKVHDGCPQGSLVDTVPGPRPADECITNLVVGYSYQSLVSFTICWSSLDIGSIRCGRKFVKANVSKIQPYKCSDDPAIVRSDVVRDDNESRSKCLFAIKLKPRLDRSTEEPAGVHQQSCIHSSLKIAG